MSIILMVIMIQKVQHDLPVTQINARDDRGGIVTVVAADQSLPEPVVDR